MSTVNAATEAAVGSPRRSTAVPTAAPITGPSATFWGRTPARPASAPAPGPYKPLLITLPKPFDDPSFEAFRKQLAEVARRKDRATLARLVAASFFWVPEDTDVADKGKPAIESLSRALDLKEPSGWETLANFAAEATAMPDPQHGGAMCAPAEPGFDDKAADELANTTQTDASDWVFPVRDGVEVRAQANASAPVVEKLGLFLIRVLPDDSPAPADRFRLRDGLVFGIISSTTEPFCASCDRSRLTADGVWLMCLYATAGTDLRRPLRAGATHAELARLIATVWSSRADRGAEERLATPRRETLIPVAALRRDAHLEMHTRGG